MPTITLAGDYKYDAQRLSDLAAGTTVDARTASFIQDNWAGDGGANNPYPIQVFNASGATIVGGTIVGQTNQTSDWATVYEHGNSAALRIENAPNAVIRDWRITNTWDAIRISWNSQNFLIEDVWITNARDDAIENDRLLSGVIKDSLFDGVFGGMSIDPSSASPVDGHNETVTMDGVLMRLQRSLYEGELTHASFIKTDSATPGTVTPNLRFINNVIAIEEVNHRSYRSLQDAWNNTVESKGNYYLNLSNTLLPADYPKPPAGWIVLQGQAARDHWDAARTNWIARHSGDETPAFSGTNYTGTNNAETILGNALDNTIYANNGNDTVEGGIGNDLIFGGEGNDTIIGQAGSDHLYGGVGKDVHNGGDDSGIDYARYDDANYGNLTIRLDYTQANTGAAAGDTYIGIEGVVGGSGNDVIVGNGLANHLYGSAGSDTIMGFVGNDYLDGGLGSDHLYGGVGKDVHNGGDDSGIDYARYDDANYGNLTIRLDYAQANTGAAAGDTYIGIEGVVGGSGNDVIVGNGLANHLYGSAGSDMIMGLVGNDYLNGGVGNDALFGGLGNDTLNGGSGSDYFQFDTALSKTANVDSIVDFVAADDSILLDNAIFVGLGLATGMLRAGAFAIGSAAKQADDRIIYNSSSGALSYDADGTGNIASIHFATLLGSPTISAADFYIV